MKQKKILTEEELAIARAKKAELKKEKLAKKLERESCEYVFHSEDKGDGSRVTVVGKMINGELYMSVAKCNPGDAFVRRIGREQALDRLKRGDFFYILTKANATRNTFIGAAKAIADAVSKHGIYRSILLFECSDLYSEHTIDSFFVDSLFIESNGGSSEFLNGQKDNFSYLLL